MNQELKQIQTNKTLDKARLITSAKRVRRSSVNRNIWLVGSGNPKTAKRFYCVMWNEELDGFTCDCKAFTFGNGEPCCHIYACCIKEGSN